MCEEFAEIQGFSGSDPYSHICPRYYTKVESVGDSIFLETRLVGRGETFGEAKSLSNFGWEKKNGFGYVHEEECAVSEEEAERVRGEEC